MPISVLSAPVVFFSSVAGMLFISIGGTEIEATDRGFSLVCGELCADSLSLELFEHEKKEKNNTKIRKIRSLIMSSIVLFHSVNVKGKAKFFCYYRQSQRSLIISAMKELIHGLYGC